MEWFLVSLLLLLKTRYHLWKLYDNPLLNYFSIFNFKFKFYIICAIKYDFFTKNRTTFLVKQQQKVCGKQVSSMSNVLLTDSHLTLTTFLRKRKMLLRKMSYFFIWITKKLNSYNWNRKINYQIYNEYLMERLKHINDTNNFSYT